MFLRRPGLLPALVVPVVVAALCAACSQDPAATNHGDEHTSGSQHTSAADPCPRAPDYTTRGTAFGTSISSNGITLGASIAKQEDNFGHLSVIRQWDIDVPPDDAWAVRTPIYGDRDVVTSFRMPPNEVLSGAHDAALEHYFQTAPRDAGDIFWTYYHEPDVGVENGELTPALFVSAFKHVIDLAQHACNPHLYPTLILTGWTAKPASHIDWKDYYPGPDYISVLGWDPYNSPIGTASTYLDPSSTFAASIRVSEGAGKPWGIAETGSNLVAHDNGTDRAAWLDRVASYLKDQGAAFVCYFQSTHGHDFELRDDPSIEAWKNWVGQSS